MTDDMEIIFYTTLFILCFFTVIWILKKWKKENGKKKDAKKKKVNIFLLYDKCNIFQIMTAANLLGNSKEEVVMCSLEAEKIISSEGFPICTKKLDTIEINNIKSLIIPGGRNQDAVKKINVAELHEVVEYLHKKEILLAAIGNSINVLSDAGILDDCISVNDVNADVYVGVNVITAKFRAYEDFGIEIGKYMRIFKNDYELRKAINFWKKTGNAKNRRY